MASEGLLCQLVLLISQVISGGCGTFSSRPSPPSFAAFFLGKFPLLPPSLDHGFVVFQSEPFFKRVTRTHRVTYGQP